MPKWIHELILERIPPFSWLPSGYNVIAQLLVMEIAGIMLGFFLELPTTSILLGTLSILAISLWSYLLSKIGLIIHRLEPPSAILEKKVIEEYKESLFSRKYELLMGGSILLFLVLYLSFINPDLVRYWLGAKISPAPLILVLLILWDISYRLGIGLWSAVISFKRSSNLRKVSGMRDKMRYTAYHELTSLKKADLINLVFGAITLLLYPLFSKDLILFMVFLIYSSTIFLFSATSLTVVGRVPGLPGEVIWLLEDGRIGYVGTSDENKQPHLTPVIFVFTRNAIFFVVSKISKKLKNIHENRRVSFLVDIRDEKDLYNNRAVLFSGKAKVFGYLDAILNFYVLLKLRTAFYKKYPQYVHKYKASEGELPLAWRTTLFLSRIIVKLEPEKMVYWRQARSIRLPLGD